MRRIRPYPVAALAGWTLFVWTNRLWLAWTDDDLSPGEKVISTVPLVLFVGLAVATVVLLVRSTDRLDPKLPTLVTGFAAFTGLYWAVRLPVILANDHEAAFKIVHSVLAIISVAFAVGAWRAVRRGSRVGQGEAPAAAEIAGQQLS